MAFSIRRALKTRRVNVSWRTSIQDCNFWHNYCTSFEIWPLLLMNVTRKMPPFYNKISSITIYAVLVKQLSCYTKVDHLISSSCMMQSSLHILWLKCWRSIQKVKFWQFRPKDVRKWRRINRNKMRMRKKNSIQIGQMIFNKKKILWKMTIVWPKRIVTPRSVLSSANLISYLRFLFSWIMQWFQDTSKSWKTRIIKTIPYFFRQSTLCSKESCSRLKRDGYSSNSSICL